MKPLRIIGLSFALLAALAAVLAAGALAAPVSSVVYDATPTPLPPNVASVGFEATSTSQFGDYVHLAGTDRVLGTVTVTMSDWALYSDYSSDTRYAGELGDVVTPDHRQRVQQPSRHERGTRHTACHHDPDHHDSLAASGRPDLFQRNGLEGRRRPIAGRAHRQS